MFRKAFLLVLPVLLLIGSATGQAGSKKQSPERPPRFRNKAEKKAYEKRKAEIRKRIQTYRAMMKKGQVIKLNVKVRVRLRNDETLVGVVKEGNFVEVPTGFEFVRAEMTAPGAGLRLWYYNRTDGYIFLPYTHIKTYRVLKKLTAIEIKEIRDEIRERERVARAEAEKRRKRLLAMQKEWREAGKSGEKLAELAKNIEQQKKQRAAEDKLIAIAEEFPPKEGWGPKRIQKINMRRLTLKIFPNEKERRFIRVYEDWKLGVDILERRKTKKKSADLTPPGGKARPQPAPPGKSR